VQKRCSELPNLRLQIDEDEPLRLLDVGPDYEDRNSPFPGRDLTLVLLFWDILNQESVVPARDRPGEFTWLPVFNEPGLVRLTLWSEDDSLGSIGVSVLPGTPESNEAVVLMAPRLAPKTRPPPGEVTWLTLIMSGSLGATPPVDQSEIDRLEEQLPTIVQHPDWAEVAEMSLARVAARVYSRSVTKSGPMGWPVVRANVERIELPELVARNLDRKVESPFASALQDDLRDEVGRLRAAERERDRETRK
jgi:hypothetical protein